MEMLEQDSRNIRKQVEINGIHAVYKWKYRGTIFDNDYPLDNFLYLLLAFSLFISMPSGRKDILRKTITQKKGKLKPY